MPDWKDGDDIDPKVAKEATKAMLRDARHVRKLGDPDDLATVDDPIEPPDDEGDEA